jgi:hypothetical protein
MKKRNRLILTLAAALALTVTIVACSHKASGTATAAQRSVRVAPVTDAALDDALHVVGLLTPKDEARLTRRACPSRWAA